MYIQKCTQCHFFWVMVSNRFDLVGKRLAFDFKGGEFRPLLWYVPPRPVQNGAILRAQLYGFKAESWWDGHFTIDIVRNASNWIGLGEMKKAGSVVETSARFTVGSSMQQEKP